jgi:D-alanyl-D-alanine carboxypeptidase
MMMLKMMKMAAVAAVLGLGSAQGMAAELFSRTNVQKLDEIIATQMKEKHLPSVMVGIWVPGEGSYVRAEGIADRRLGRHREPTELFRIASISKTFTGTAILQLVDQGKLKKSDKIAKWYPHYPRANEITIEHLLTMRSGMPDPVGEDFVEEYFRNRRTHLTAADMVERGAKLGRQFKTPGKKTVYNNLNFIMLAEIAEKVTGKRFDRVLADQVFRPLDLKNSFYPFNPYLYGHLRGYSVDPKTGEFIDVTLLNPQPAGGAGAVVSNLTDLRKYVVALCKGTLLKPETQKARLEGTVIDGSPDFVKYGEGILRLGPFCGHNGTIFGFSSEAWYLPQNGAVLIIDVNRLDVDDQSKTTDMFFLITKALFGQYVPW